MMKCAILSIAMMAAVSGCARREEEPEVAGPPAAEAAAIADGAATDVPEPPKVVATVKADIRLSAEAQKAVAAQADTVIVEALYAGDPTPESQGQVNELGLIELGKTSQKLSGSGSVGFDKSSIDAARLSLIVGQPQVILNVHSQKGLIVCPMYWESVKVASEKTVQIDCTSVATPQ